MLFERKEKEEKHRAWTDPSFIARDHAFAKKLHDDERNAANLAMFNQAFPPNRNQPIVQPIIIPANQNQNDEIARLQARLNKIEKEDKEMEDRIRNVMILDNPRLLQAFYPSRPIYNPSKIIDAAILAELDKKERSDMMYKKLKDIYGDDAPAKYLNRALTRIDAEKPPQMIEHPPRRRSRSKSKSKKPTKKKSKSPKPKHKKK